MRGATGNLIIDEEKKLLIGVNLGADYCAEHEWGIAGIRQAFGMYDDPKVFGKDRRLVRQVDPKKFVWTTTKYSRNDYTGLWLKAYVMDSITEPNMMECYNKELYTGWSGRDLAVLTKVDWMLEYVKELYDYILKQDAVIWLGGNASGNPFARSRLCIGIASRMPEKALEQWYTVDKEAYEVDQEVEATGIRKKLADAGKRYFSLSPGRDEKGNLTFWLNPMEQHLYESCWCRLQDLLDWIEDKGKIVKKSAKEGRRRHR